MKKLLSPITSRLASTIHSRRGRRRLIGLAAIGVLCIGVWLVVRLLEEPAQGRIIAAPHDSLVTQAPPKQVSPAATLQNSYFTLPLPSGYEVQANPQTPAGVLYDQTLIKSGDLGSLIIAIAVEQMPDGGLSSDPSYRLRQQQPAEYQLTTKVIDGDTVTIANNPESAAVVAFWPHGNYLAMKSLYYANTIPRK